MAAEHAHAVVNAIPAARTGPWPFLAGWPRGPRFASLCLALMIVPGILAGGPLLAAAKVYGFYLGWVLLPGLALLGLLGRRDGAMDDELSSAGMALALGTVLIGLFVFFCRLTGLHGAIFGWPLSALVLLALAHIRGPGPLAATPLAASAPRERWIFVAILLLVLVRVPTGFAGPLDGWYMLEKDLVFHGGNAAELLKEGPLIDPRVAGRPLNYHLLSHALAAGMSVVTGESVADLFRFWFLGFYPLVLMMLVFALARRFGNSIWAGLAAVLVLVLHDDVGEGLFGEERRSAWSFGSHLDLGVFFSTTTCLGLALLVAQAAVLLRWCDAAQRVGVREVMLLALLALGASMAKGSVMPAAIAGAGFAFLVASVRARRPSPRWFAATLVLLVASLPATLYLSFGPGSYVGAMFRVAPWASALSSQMGIEAIRGAPFLERLPFWLAGFLVTLPWLVGFLGMSGVGALSWVCAGRPNLGGLGPWILGVALAGLGAGTLLFAPGSSQLFFAYDAQLVLALPAGAGAVWIWKQRPRMALVLALLALPFLAGGLGGIARALHARVLITRDGPKLWPRWREGAEWLRTNTDPHALVVSREDGLLLTLFAERRVALAETRYTPESHATRWRRVKGQWRIGPSADDPFLQRRGACEQALQGGDKASLARLRASTGHAGELYVVHDRVQFGARTVRIERVRGSDQLDASPALERVFQNDAMSIYRAIE